MWTEVLEGFEQHAPVGVMARVALEQALPAGWIDEVFEASRQRQYPRELMMSTVVELMMLVSLGLRPSLHAAARKMERLPVSLAALYDKVNRTEPAVLRALVGFVKAMLAYNVLSLLKRFIEQAHREQAPELDVSTYHLAVDVVSNYKGMLIALPPSAWSSWSEASPERTAHYLLDLARFVSPRSVATSKRGPKKPKPKGYVEAAAVRKHVSIARVLRNTKEATP